LISQVFLKVGHIGGQEPNGYKKEEDSSEEFKWKTQVGPLFLLLSIHIKGNQVRLYCGFVSKALPYLSGIE